MIKVANRKVIYRLSFRSFQANRIRNIVAILAIALTTILFTSLFTVMVSLNYSAEQQYMRMVGGSAHGSFKYLTEEQADQLKVNPLIREYGTSLMLAMPKDAPFNKHHTEIRYADHNGAKMFFSLPTTGRMPEDTMELATDTAVLDLLGIAHKIGQKVILTYPLGDKIITDTFILCGFWQTDEASLASQVWLSKDYVTKQLEGYDIENSYDKITGTWNLDVMFADSRKIQDKMQKLTEENGYTSEDQTAPNYLAIGVNPAYTSTHMNAEDSIMMAAAMVILILLITFTGYLIIYNIFQISVSGDVRFYGLLKTIGTTPRQIRRLVRNQAFLLSVLGIPIGLMIGFIVGNKITPVIMSNMMDKRTFVTFNPWIFAGAALFSLLTVAISLRKPGKMAAGVSPIEAVRYTEGNEGRKKYKNTKNGAKVYQMAKANLGLNKKKTILVILSLSLSVILLNTTYIFAKGFDMDKFISKFVVTDFMVGHSDYFRSDLREENQKVTDSMIDNINSQEGITESGRVYADTFIVSTNLEESVFKRVFNWYPQDYMESQLQNRDENGKIVADVDLYGLEDFPMKQLTLMKGTLDMDKIKSGHYLAQVIFADDYGNPQMDQVVYNVGDKVKLHYCTDYKYSEKGELTELNGWDVEYEVMAVVMMPGNMSRRAYGDLPFITSAETFKKDTGTDNTMIYMYNVDDGHTKQMESFIKDYTDKREPDMDYESKDSYLKQFGSFRNMFLLIGSVLSSIIGIVGVLNFINAELTSIMSRRREFAMLQGIGMTGKQLKKMLVYEGIFYGIISITVSLIISVLVGYFALRPMEDIMWFFSFHLTVTPILLLLPIFLLLGVVIPLLSYKITNRKSIVEQLREAE
ncbi:MAG: FtsX-like permease family protein [Anaerocolumna sp.]